MSFMATRLTCYALLSALENDLRSEIAVHISDDNPAHALGSERSLAAQARRSKDLGTKQGDSLTQLLPYLDFADSYEVLLRNAASLPQDLSTQIRTLTPWLERLVAVRNRVAHSRPMEIDDLPNVLDVCSDLSSSSGARWEGVRETIAGLTRDPSYVLGLTVDLPTNPDPAPQNNLPVPDFDETGFFGRRAQIQRIKRAIKGAYPVVSVLGEGGIGKTAIALKVAYELLDEAKPVFDVFVWVTAKATVLTASEILRINDAIQDSLGLFESAAAEFVNLANPADAISEILAYMETFRVLLILDNMETVLDQRLRDFLLDLPMGSKVLITSRIGLGIENPVQLEPLSADEAASLLRAVARIRQVKPLENLSQERIIQLANQMSGHPAYIKWFVAGVQSGRRPEELLSDNQLLLEFCMSNVYEYLTEDARSVLRSMQSLPGQRGQAELAFINDFQALRIQASLLELLTTNFVQMQSRSPTQPFDTTYVLTDFGRKYLDKAHAVEFGERAWLQGRDEQLREFGASLFAENSANPLDTLTVEIRGIGDFHVAKLLRDSIKIARDGQHDAALASCREAQLLSPTFHEAWRIEAHVQDLRGDIAAANSAFERALELAPDSWTLCYFYGTFIRERVNSPGQALIRLQQGARLAPECVPMMLQIILAHLTLGSHADCISMSVHLLSGFRLTEPERDSALVAATRAAVYVTRLSLNSGDHAAALEMVESIINVVGTKAPAVNSEALDRLLQLSETCTSISNRTDDRFIRQKAEEFALVLRSMLLGLDPIFDGRCAAQVVSVVREKGYGFVKGGDKVDLFFHVRDLADSADWDYIDTGVVVMMTPNGSHDRGPRATRVRILD